MPVVKKVKLAHSSQTPEGLTKGKCCKGNMCRCDLNCECTCIHCRCGAFIRGK